MTPREKLTSFLALFTSTGTLLCCALPAAIAALAGGAAVGSLLSAFPWLMPLSQRKGWIFIAAALMVSISGVLTLRPSGKTACAINGGRPCELAGRFQKAAFWTSAILLAVSAFFAYGLVPILRRLDL